MTGRTIYARSDIDGLLGCAILKEAGYAGDIEFLNPLDILSGSAMPGAEGVWVNLPGPASGKWDRNRWHPEEPEPPYATASEAILTTIGDPVLLSRFGIWLEDLSRWFRREINAEDIANPSPIIKLAYLCDPITGLGRYRDFMVSNYFFLLDLIEQLRRERPEDLLECDDVRDRLEFVSSRRVGHEAQIRRTLHGEGALVFQDLREEARIEPGNPMVKHFIAPPHDAILTAYWDKNHRKVSVALGVAVGKATAMPVCELLMPYGGGGDAYSAVAQVLPEEFDGLFEYVKTSLETWRKSP